MTATRAMIRGLTLRHPWPWVFEHADKDVENRNWPPRADGGETGMYLALHGGRTPPDTYALEMFQAIRWLQEIEVIPYGPVNWPSVTVPGIVAVAQLTSVTRNHPSRWAVPSSYHWALNVTVLPEVVPHRGGKGLWALEARALERVRALYAEAKRAA